MRVVHFTVSERGGAGIAAGRSVEALRQHAVDAALTTAGDRGWAERLVGWRRWRHRIDNAPIRLYRERTLFSSWSNNWLPSLLASRVGAPAPDVVHLHWLGDGTLNWSELRALGAPVVWTLHDAWAFTGGCHYPKECRRFLDTCGMCPQLGSRNEHDLSWRNLRRKKRYAGEVARWITPSRWLGELAAKSGTIAPERLRVIPNGLDGGRYRRIDGRPARRCRGISDDTVVLVTGAADLSEARKGVEMMPEMLHRLQAMTGRSFVLMLFGEAGKVAGEWPAECVWTGRLSTPEDMSEALSMADVFVLPSLQDNLPNVIVEALACGCPAVGFNAGGLEEIVETGVTGWVTNRIDAEGLAAAVCEWLRVAPDRSETAERCRRRFEEKFTLERHGRALAELYAEVLAERGGGR